MRNIKPTMIAVVFILIVAAFVGCPGNGGDGNGGNGGNGGGTGYVPPPSPAAFSVSNLSIEPAEVGSDETVNVSLTVANTGGSQGSHDVVLNINGVQEEAKSVTIAAGSSDSVTFNVTREDAGTYAVAVDGLSGSFTVTSSDSSGGRYVIVDTDQTIFYDNADIISAPSEGEPFYGQDAQYQGAQPSYNISVDGLTVYDNNTGLTWLKSPDLDDDGDIDIDDQLTWAEAQAYVATLNAANYGGYSDWRLPTIKELYSLILFSGIDLPAEGAVTNAVPFIDTDYFDFEYGDTSAGDRIIDAQYWSSTQYVSTTMNGNATVFGVNFADGRIKGYPRDIGRGGQAAKQFVRYVRGNPDYGVNDYIDNGNGTITDRATGLMWSQTDSGVGMNWEDALAWVQQKNAENYLGYNDWRLPNAKELQSIVDYTRSPATTNSAAIDPIFQVTSIIDERGETNYPFYWTSTTHVSIAGGGDAAVYIAFGEAFGYMMNSWIDVHGAGAQRSDPKSGNPDDYPNGRGPQGDAIRIDNFIRLVRDA